MGEPASPLLTLCVPTYNRSACLRECVMSVLDCLEELGEDASLVEFLVSDDASPDDTEAVMREIVRAHPSVGYRRNPRNLYTDIHFSEIIERAHGEYFWMMGDDDKLERRAVREVLERIRRGRNLIVCNYSVWTKDFSQRVRENGLGRAKDIDFDDPNRVLAEFGINLGFISSVVGRKAHFLAIPEAQRKRFEGFTFPQVFPLFAGQLGDCRATLIADPIVQNRSGNNSESKWHHIFVTGSTTIFDALGERGFSRWAVRAAKLKVLVDYVIPSTFELRIHQLNPKGLLGFLARAYWRFPVFWLTCVPVLLAPGRLVSRWRGRMAKVPLWVKRAYGTLI